MQEFSRLATALAERYRIERELGRGGMATVWLAHDLRHGRDVALKVLRPDLAAVLGAERFLNEVRITARLDHPHILTLIDSGETKGFLWYVVPWIRGESLRARLDRERQLGVDEALAITRQVASALAYAHRQGVIHRDIKPENVLLHEGEAVLADFGIALAVRQAGGNRLTETGISLGTPQYMSPEQATGDRELDARSDLYSLAAVLYEMLAGEPPLTGATVQAVIARLLTERPTRLRILRDTIPEPVDAAVAQALAKLPIDRQASVAEFAAALATPPSHRAVEPPRHPAARRPAVLIGAVLLVGLGLAAFALLRRPGERVIQPDRVQLTFTGNARTPALSADSRRLAYSARQCDTLGNCTTDVILQDLGGAGATTLLQAWGSIENLEWTADGRYLLVTGFQGAGQDWGLYAVPTLGGAPRHLIRGTGYLVGATDTVLAVRPIVGDTVSWLRWITIADGVTRDSLALPGGLGVWYNFRPFADGRKLILVRDGGGGWTATIMDRSGQPLDSLSVTEPGMFLIGPSQDGRILLTRAVDAFDQRRDNFSLLAWRLRPDGRVEGGPDTVLRGMTGGATLAPDGNLLVQGGPRHFEVWALERTGPTIMDFTERRLTSATGVLDGDLSPTGDRVLLRRESREDGRTVNRFSLLPFEGGQEVPFDLPPGAFGAGWHRSGTGLLAFYRPSGDTAQVREMDLATGAVRSLLDVPFRRVIGRGIQPEGGGFLVPVRDPVGIWRVGAPGQRDTIFEMGDRWAGFHGIDVSPDGEAVVWVGWDRLGDSVLVERVSLADGRARRLAAFYPYDGGQPHWLSDGTILVGIEETAASLAWYRIAEDGGPPVRLGSPPRFPAEYSLSRNGLRVVATVAEDSPDIYLIRNFGRLLGR